MSGMQMLGRLIAPARRPGGRRRRPGHGVDVQPVSINYHHDAPEHGLLLGYAGLDERETLAAIAPLQAVLPSLEASERRAMAP